MNLDVATKVTCPYAVHVHPQSERIQKHTLLWVKELRFSAKEVTRIEKANTGLVASFWLHFANVKYPQLVADWISFICLFDDVSERNTSSVVVHLVNESCKLVEGKQISLPKTEGKRNMDIVRLIRALSNLLQRTYSIVYDSSESSSPSRYLPYIKSLKNSLYSFLQAYATEAIMLQQREKEKEKGLPTSSMSLSAYMAFRSNHFGMRFLSDVMFIIMMETEGYFDDKMPTTLYEGLCKAASAIGFLVNDLVGLAKDIKRGHIINVVPMYQNDKKCTLEEAVAGSLKIYEKQYHMFEEYANQLSSNNSWVEVLRGMIAGVHEWHFKSGRYKKARTSPLLRALPTKVTASVSSPSLRNSSAVTRTPLNMPPLSIQFTPSSPLSPLVPSRTQSPPPLNISLSSSPSSTSSPSSLPTTSSSPLKKSPISSPLCNTTTANTTTNNTTLNIKPDTSSTSSLPLLLPISPDVIGSSSPLSENNIITSLNSFFPEISKVISNYLSAKALPEDICQWVQQMITYTTVGGNMMRACSVVESYMHFSGKKVLDAEEMRNVCTLGWCAELLQAYFLVHDDLMDNSTVRRNKPCWYKQAGLMAVNDGSLLRSLIFILLRHQFKKPGNSLVYSELLEIFQEVSFETEIGQLMDTLPSRKDNLMWNKDPAIIYNYTYYQSAVTQKTAFYSFYLPLKLGATLAKNNTFSSNNTAISPNTTVMSPNIYDDMLDEDMLGVCKTLGEYFQVIDDYADYFVDAKVLGKVGTDIEEGKCSWVVVTALSMLSNNCDTAQQQQQQPQQQQQQQQQSPQSPQQLAASSMLLSNAYQLATKEELLASYGKSDTESVSAVKQIYNSLDIPTQFAKYRSITEANINRSLVTIRSKPASLALNSMLQQIKSRITKYNI